MANICFLCRMSNEIYTNWKEILTYRLSKGLVWAVECSHLVCNKQLKIYISLEILLDKELWNKMRRTKIQPVCINTYIALCSYIMRKDLIGLEDFKYLAIFVGCESPYPMFVLSYSGRDICTSKQYCPISRSTIQTHSCHKKIYMFILLHSHGHVMKHENYYLYVFATLDVRTN